MLCSPFRSRTGSSSPATESSGRATERMSAGRPEQHLEDAERGAEEAGLGLGRHERHEDDEHAEVDDAHGEREGERERLAHEPRERLAVRAAREVARCGERGAIVTG